MSGYYETSAGITIDKSIEGVTTFAIDWSQWLNGDDLIQTVDYTLEESIYDTLPDTLVKVSQGIDTLKKITYVTLSNGIQGKYWRVNVKVTTALGIIESRYFIVHVKALSLSF